MHMLIERLFWMLHILEEPSDTDLDCRYFIAVVGLVLLPVVVLLMMVSGCAIGYTPSVRDVSGVYKLDYVIHGRLLGRETLELKPNGTYVQIFTPPTGRPIRNSGRWMLTSINGGTKLVLEDFLVPVDEFGRLTRPILRAELMTDVTKAFGRVSFSPAILEGPSYRKIR